MSKSTRQRANRSNRQLFARLAGLPPEVIHREALDIGRRNHNALERSCADLAQIKYKIELLKADAESFIRQNGSRGSRCTPGIPDRVCALPPTGRFVGFEFKTGGGTPNPNQKRVHKLLRENGAAVYVIRSINQFDRVLGELLQEERDRHTCQEIGRSQRETAIRRSNELYKEGQY